MPQSLHHLVDKRHVLHGFWRYPWGNLVAHRGIILINASFIGSSPFPAPLWCFLDHLPIKPPVSESFFRVGSWGYLLESECLYPHKKFITWNLSPKVMVLGEEAFWEWIGHIHTYIQREDSSLWTRKRVPIRHKICQCLDLGFPSLHNC